MKKKKIIFIILLIFVFTLSIQNILGHELDPAQSFQKKRSNETETYLTINTLPLEKGDIVWRWVNEDIFPLLQFFMHPLMFTGNITDNTYEFVEAHGGKDVCLTHYTEYQIKNKGIFRYGNRLKDEYFSSEKIDRIVTFATVPDRLDDEFVSLFYFDEEGYIKYHEKNADPYDPFDPLSDKWYCTELIWAAYKSQGIELDTTDGPVLSADIQLSPYLERFVIY